MKLANLAVHPDHGGQGGIGRRLIATCEAAARDLGAGEVRLNTHVDMPENVALYTRLGWQEVARRGTTVMMVKPL